MSCYVATFKSWLEISIHNLSFKGVSTEAVEKAMHKHSVGVRRSGNLIELRKICRNAVAKQQRRRRAHICPCSKL